MHMFSMWMIYVAYIYIYINNYFGPYQTDPGPVSDWIVNEKKKKKKLATDVHAATSTAA